MPQSTGHTSDGSKSTQHNTPGAFGSDTAYQVEMITGLDARRWRALGKQARHGAAVKLTTRQ